MSDDLNNFYDIAIVGGGVSGLYAAWRLASQKRTDSARIAVFESSNRIGGRLWSVDLRHESAIPAELGGMFFNDAQPIVYGLCTGVLGLRTRTVTPRPDFAYLRGERFRISEFAEPGILPYRLEEDEQGLPYHQLIFLALKRIVPDLDEYWPLSSNGNIQATIEHLRNVKFEGRELYYWGFWNLLSKVLSNEAYMCLRDIVSSYALFSNWNAYDACLSLLSDLTGHWFNLPDGYQRLPEHLASEAQKRGVEIHFNSCVSAIHGGSHSTPFSIEVQTGDTRATYSAKSMILAIPKRAIESIDPESSVFESGKLQSSLEAVESVPACKIFLTFDEPWWRRVPDGPGRIGEGSFAASHTDLPMRQCYYLGTDPKTGEGLMLASYSDAQSVPFWSALMTKSGRTSGLRTDVPKPAREEIRRQLSEMHGMDVPEPTDGVFINWTAPPYGGGWHAWLPGWRSYEVMAALRRPDGGRHFSVCGESVCAYQGWVEGALTSTEVMLQEQFDLPAPEWLSSTDTLAPYTPHS